MNQTTSAAAATSGTNTSVSPSAGSDSSSSAGCDKWWLTANQMLQTSKLELSANLSQLILPDNSTTKSTATTANTSTASTTSRSVRIPAVDYFTMRSDMPDICKTESDVKMNDTLLITPSVRLNSQQLQQLPPLQKQQSSCHADSDNNETQADQTLCEENKEPAIKIVVS